MTAYVRKLEDPAAYKAAAKATINAAAGEARAALVTSLPLQDYVYSQKLAEAQAYLSAPLGDYPWLEAEADALGSNVATVAANIIAAKATTDATLIAVEAARVEALAGVDGAANQKVAIDAVVTAANAAFATIVSTYS